MEIDFVNNEIKVKKTIKRRKNTKKEQLKKLKNIISPDLINDNNPTILTLIRYKVNIIKETLKKEFETHHIAKNHSIANRFNLIFSRSTISAIPKFNENIDKTKSNVELTVLEDVMKTYPINEKKKLRRITKAYNRKSSSRQYKISTIRKKLHQIGYRYNKPSRIDYRAVTKMTSVLKAIFINEFEKLIKKGYQFIFIDETYLGNHIDCGKSWTNIYDKEIPSEYKRIPMLNAICAVSNNGFKKYTISTESNNAKTYMDFLKELYDELYDHEFYSKFMTDKKIVFFADNCSFHNDVENIKYFEDLDIIFLFNSPYSPRYNMIEQIFQIVKAKMRFNNIDGKNNRINEFSKSFESIELKTFKNVYCNAISCMIDDIEILFSNINLC